MQLSITAFLSRRSLNEWLYVALVLAVFGGYIAYSLFQQRVAIETHEQEQLANQAKIVADNLGSQLNSANLALAGVLRSLPDWRLQKEGARFTNQHLKALSDAMPGVLTMVLIDAKGIVVNADRPELVGRDVSQREYFKTVQRYPDPGTLYVSVPFQTTWGLFTLNLARLIPGPAGGFGGMVVAVLDPAEFKALLNSVIYATDMSASLVHGEGMLFLTTPDKTGLVGFDQERPNSFFSQHMKSGRKTNVFTGASFPQLDESMVAMMTVRPDGLSMNQPLVVALSRDRHAITAKWHDDVMWHGGLFGIVALFALVGLIYYQRQWHAFDADAVKRKAELQQTVEAMRESEERFRSLTKLSSDWYWEQDEQFRFVRLHGKLDQKTDAANESHAGKTRWEMGALNLTEADWDKHRAVLQAHQEFHEFEMQRRDNDGKLYWISISGAPIWDAQGVFRGYRGVARDISAQKSAEDEIKRQALYDSLTQLPNRRLFIERIGFAFAASKRSKQYGALIFLDLDNFKPLNDSHGHAAGDLLLIEAARRITACVRQVDTAARFGGDEFAVILCELDADFATARTNAALVAEKIHAALAAPYELKLQMEAGPEVSVTHRCTASIGVAMFIGHEADQKEILKQADMAMYQAKADGRNLIRFHDAEA